MKKLDGDEVRVSSNGVNAERDIVQFVAFRDFIGGHEGDDQSRSQALLAKEVLAEIPEQFVSYMKSNGIKPRIQRQTTTSSVNSSRSSYHDPPEYNEKDSYYIN